MNSTRRWPLFLIAAPAAVAVWSGWVGLGGMCGFGLVHPLPGIADSFRLNTAITLPIGVEAYGAFALGAWLTGPDGRARRFARKSAVGSLLLGMLGQIAFHVLSAEHATRAPWPVTVGVACLPVATLGFGVSLAHLLRADTDTPTRPATEPPDATTGAVVAAVSAEQSVFGASEATAVVAPSTCAKWQSRLDLQAILREMPTVSGAELGRRLGVSERHGQRILASLASK